MIDPVSYAAGKSAGSPSVITPEDEGKVVVHGALEEQVTRTVVDVGSYDTTGVKKLTVEIQAANGKEY